MTRRQPPARTRRLSDRDIRVLQTVAQFKQLTVAHIQSLVFPDVTSTPVYDCLHRLTDMRYLTPTERLTSSGRGGSGRYVYSLSRAGFDLLYVGEYARPRVADTMHTLAIADVAVALKQLERAGQFAITALLTEPDCHITVGGRNLNPDMSVELERGGRKWPLWFEVQRSYKSPKNLDLKFRAYYDAYRYADGEQYPVWPTIFWVALYPEYANAYRGGIAKLPEEARAMFRVRALDDLPSLFT
jgi:hypothetical protein